MKEEQNQPEVMQELLLKLINDLQILKGIQQENKEPAAQSFTPYWNFSMIDDEEARENFMKDICTFLRKFSRISFRVTPNVILIAWERFSKIKNALTEKQYRQEDIQELMSKLLEDYTIIYSKPKAITPDLPIEEPDNSLSMGDEHLDTIPSVENLVPIPSEFKGISEDTCDVPVCKDPSTFDALSDHSEMLFDSSDNGTSSDDDDFEDIEYVSLEEVDPNQGGLTSVVMDEISDNSTNDPLLELPEFESFHFDPSFPHTPPEPPDVEISLFIETDAPVINNFDELNEDECFDPGGGEIDVSQNIKDDVSFTFIIRTFLPFLTYHVDSPLLLSTGSEDTIFDPDIFTYSRWIAWILKPLVLTVLSFNHKSFISSASFRESDILKSYRLTLSVRKNSRRMKNDRVKYEWDAKQGLVGNLKSSSLREDTQYLSMGEFGTDIKEIDKNQSKKRTKPNTRKKECTIDENYQDGSSCIDGSGAGLILKNPDGVEFTYAMRFRFEATNNEVEYEAFIAGLRIAEQMGVKNLQANVDFCLVANQVNGSYIAKESVPRSENKKANALSKIASTSFTHLSKHVLVEELNEKSIHEKEVLAIVEEEG
ncbi:reverse transcriptase domain-containing protein [Tanacetum coccineum]|uniref:Reverse transcriptase domain-containing protein n=1 Tax=Tanacetum coccineum TaxID=301880 RepID=A0ABQ4XN75_9ASTR